MLFGGCFCLGIGRTTPARMLRSFLYRLREENMLSGAMPPLGSSASHSFIECPQAQRSTATYDEREISSATLFLSYGLQSWYGRTPGYQKHYPWPAYLTAPWCVGKHQFIGYLNLQILVGRQDDISPNVQFL